MSTIQQAARQRVAVLGGGSFGTTLANIMADNGHAVMLWLRDEARAEEINREHRNSAYLPELALHEKLQATTNLAAAVADRDFVFMAVPSSSCRAVAKEVKRHIDKRSILISTTKGLEASHVPEPNSFRLMSEVLREEIPEQRLGVLSGPNLAKEIAARQITATVIASRDDDLNAGVQELLRCGYFRVYASSDMYGVELAGALKNVYAIIAGMANALGIGHNTIAMLITRALAEMTRFGVRKGADPLTFMGLAGVGDLMVTCMSPLSRNYQVGVALGQGKNLDTIVAELGQVAEGINTLKLLKLHSEQINVRMPLVAGLYEILYNGRSIPEVVGKLMWAEQNRDVEFSLK